LIHEFTGSITLHQRCNRSIAKILDSVVMMFESSNKIFDSVAMTFEFVVKKFDPSVIMKFDPAIVKKI
jgi:hypothetical protein